MTSDQQKKLDDQVLERLADIIKAYAPSQSTGLFAIAYAIMRSAGIGKQ